MLRVGLHPDPPWVEAGEAGTAGVEVELVKAFASDLGAELERVEHWRRTCSAAIKAGELDDVIGGSIRRRCSNADDFPLARRANERRRGVAAGRPAPVVHIPAQGWNVHRCSAVARHEEVGGASGRWSEAGRR